MSNIGIKVLYSSIRKYATAQGGLDENAKLFEVCDFGDSYGFLFESDDVYSNCYWCVNKKTYEPFSFRPNQDIKKFMHRKVMGKEEVG